MYLNNYEQSRLLYASSLLHNCSVIYEILVGGKSLSGQTALFLVIICIKTPFHNSDKRYFAFVKRSVFVLTSYLRD